MSEALDRELIVGIFVHLLSRARIDLSTEKAAQADIAAVLDANGTAYFREHRLGPGDIVDFFLPPDLAVEVKMQRARPVAIGKQLERYAAYPQVGAIVLVTNRAIPLPALIAGKRAFQLSLGRAWL